MRRFVRAVAILVLGASLLTIAGRSASRRLLFAGRGAPGCSSPIGFIAHAPIARDGVVGRALELPAIGGAATIVYFHNNRDTAEARADLARALHARGLGVLLVEYRGYGASNGPAPTEEGLYLDAEAALDVLAGRGIGPDGVVLWGTSLGTGVAAEMARRGRGSRLVLETPYTSIPDLVRAAVPFLPAGVLISDHFDTLSKARDIRVPTLVIQGDADEIVPFAMGERVARAIPGARLLRVEHGRHGDLFVRERDRLLEAIATL